MFIGTPEETRIWLLPAASAATTTAAASAAATATTATAAVATTTATAATAAVAAATTSAAAALTFRARFVDGEGAALILFAIRCIDGFLHVLFGNLYKPESSALNDPHFSDGSIGFEKTAQAFFIGAVGQVAYIKRFVCQLRLPSFPNDIGKLNGVAACKPATEPITRRRYSNPRN